LRDAERVDDADDKKVAIRLLADFLADKRWRSGRIRFGFMVI
jgi:hypothetical protein